MLLILEHLMYKLKVTEDLPEIPHPCNYFDLIGGTSTGGLIALMLGRLRMSVKDSMEAYGQLVKEVFSDVRFQGGDKKLKTSKLEKAIKQILQAYLASHDPEDKLEDIQDNACKTFAGRATSADPTFFEQIEIRLSGIEEEFVDGGISHNNPTASLLSEAKEWLQTDCEKTHQFFADHFAGTENLYFRFNVEQGLQNIPPNQWEKLSHVAANTRQYIQSQLVITQLAKAATSLSEKRGKVSAGSLAPVLTAIEMGQSQVVPTLVGCPPPSQIFQGRQDILARMKDPFSKDIGKRHVYVLHGLGGSGKTQIALKFLNMMNQYPTPRFTKQFFINASSQQTLDTAFKNIAIANKIGNSFQDALSWLITGTKEWMLLFDNADDPNINLFLFFPQCTHGNIIITSRNPQLAVHGPRSHSKVGNMEETDAIELLLLSAAEDNTVETAKRASEIVKELCYLPLAIIQAGAYISKFNCLDQYLSLYKQDHARLLKEHPEQSHNDYEWTVYTTWQISFKQLSKVAAQFLQLCSLLHHDKIPEAIFQKAAEWTGDVQNVQQARAFLQNFLTPSMIWNQQLFMGIIAEIAAYSLVNRHPGAVLSIHPLVQLWCRNTLANEPKVRECMMDILGMSVMLTDDEDMFRIGLIVHMDSLVQDPATVKPVFLAEYAQIYFDSSRYKEAESLEVTALEKQKQHLGANHSATLLTMENLAVTYHHLGRYQAAEPLEVTVMEKRKQLFGEDHPETLHAMGNWLPQSEGLAVTVLEKQKQLFGADHLETLRAMGNLAATYRWLGRYQESEALEVTVLERQRQVFGADHPDTLHAMAHLAVTYHRLGRYQAAEPLEVTVLEKRTQLFGADHPETLRAMGNLAATYRWLGRFQESEALQVTVLEKQRQVFGVDHPDTLQAMAHLAVTYHQLGRYLEAEPLEVTVLEKRKQLLGADHPDTLYAMENLAATYHQIGRYQESEPLAVTVLEKRRQVFAADHPDTLHAMAHLAIIYHQLGKYQEAEPLEVSVLEKQTQLFGADHPETLHAMRNLATTYHQLGRYQEAKCLCWK
ncbi:hypothetical protein DFH08DRAFT_801816 [Mycena albidolilacea]|uniref:PNPLA domain-containing protein n=1 Tax=Mycena albidolilacea TaxID=1033008 RepID=A0AAD7AG43_9AGAR|nr:hypothetical protein DFH08DRAFT_801816 [Mycena albidolilacea]